ncbi:MAG TPA: non-canonical purine NTP pyrophosphatase [Verrucomicrobiae bacterium]|nr:non-canonical purine NTP pyrophosphatase [Verrucomicrobiae bacterium]
MTTLLIATRNAHKVGEIQSILGPQFQFLTLNDFPGAPVVMEDADTFAGNAAKKAVELARWLAAKHSTFNIQRPASNYVLADDSGLEVDALDGAPGVHSARFAALDRSADGPSASSAENSPDTDNNAKLLRLLKAVPVAERTARFRCVIALVPVVRGKVESASPVCYAEEFAAQSFDGTCEGRIQLAASGRGGFGYDPLFVPDGFTQSFAELGEDVKNKLSHRAKALEKLKKFFIVK